MDVFEAIQPFRTDEYRLNERASTIQDNTGATGLVSQPQPSVGSTHGDPKGKESVMGRAMHMRLLGNRTYLRAIKE